MMKALNEFPIYLDYMSTTPVDPKVKAAMLPYLDDQINFGNPSSNLYVYGKYAKYTVENARALVAKTIGAQSDEIFWTSGATEAINMALKGAVWFYQRKGKHIIVPKTEHKAVLATCRYLEAKGFEVTYLRVDANGLIDFDHLEQCLRPETILVSVAYVNNEIGVIQDIKKVSDILQNKGILFHIDAAQALGKFPVDVKSLCVDLASFSAHKVYGPKGVGALYVRKKPRIHLEPLLHGGGQEHGLRGGTLPVHQIIGMAEAFKIVRESLDQESARIKMLHDRLWQGLQSLAEISLNGDENARVVHNLNVSFNGLKDHVLLPHLKQVAVSAGAACSTGNAEPSHVLRAIGLDLNAISNTIRFSLGRFTTTEEIELTLQHIDEVLKQLR